MWPVLCALALALVFTACTSMLGGQSPLPPHVGTGEPVPPLPGPPRAEAELPMPHTSEAPERSPTPHTPTPTAPPSTLDPFKLPVDHKRTPPPLQEEAWNRPEAHYQRFVTTMERVKGELLAEEANREWGPPATIVPMVRIKNELRPVQGMTRDEYARYSLGKDDHYLLATWPARKPNDITGLNRPVGFGLECLFDIAGILQQWKLIPAEFDTTPTEPTPALQR